MLNITKKQLTENQKELLKVFIKQFLPKRGTKRKNSGNEIDYIQTTLNLVFKKYFGFNLDREDIINAFEELDYSIYTKNAVWDSESKTHKASNKGNIVRFGDVYSKYNTAFLYIDIEPIVVRQLMLTVKALPVNTKEIKVKATNEMKNLIELFIKVNKNTLI